MINGIKWYVLRLYFADYARGPVESLESHVVQLAKRFNLVAVTVLRESFHYHKFGTAESTQLFGAKPGTKPVFIELFVSEVKVDSFLNELEELVLEGKSNIFYSKQEVNGIVGNPSVFKKIDDYKEN